MVCARVLCVCAGDSEVVTWELVPEEDLTILIRDTDVLILIMILSLTKRH
jgi:hypothetical protein